MDRIRANQAVDPIPYSLRLPGIGHRGRSAMNMTLSEFLITEYGENPMGFFWILSDTNDNPHLSHDRQNKIWKESLIDEDWFVPFSGRADLIMITDNGDLVFDIDSCSTLLANPRSGTHEFYQFSVDEFLKMARGLNSSILPSDL